MGRIRTFHTDGRRDYTQEGIYPELLTLPTSVPDLPEVRSDYAGRLEAVQDVDTWLGFFLKDLKEKGLDDNTIIFFFSDHGGCVPRGKGYLYESGLEDAPNSLCRVNATRRGLKKKIIVLSSSPFSFQSFRNPSHVSTSCTASRWPA